MRERSSSVARRLALRIEIEWRVESKKREAVRSVSPHGRRAVLLVYVHLAAVHDVKQPVPERITSRKTASLWGTLIRLVFVCPPGCGFNVCSRLVSQASYSKNATAKDRFRVLGG